jgi:hypothetical protein
MLSYESMKVRLDNPKAYYVFYEYFYKAAVGEIKWKQALKRGVDERLGNNNTEAFAHVVLQNNYDAWWFAMKDEHGDLLKTEYDTIPGESCKSICELILEDIEFDLQANGLLLTGHMEGTTADRIELSTMQMMRRNQIRTRLELQTRIFEEHQDKGSGVQGALEDQQNCMGDRSQINKKKRKLMKGLKRFTGTPTSSEERRFKGWSDTGHKALEDMVKEIKTDVEGGRYMVWERLYRELVFSDDKNKENEHRKKKPYQVDTTIVWDL